MKKYINFHTSVIAAMFFIAAVLSIGYTQSHREKVLYDRRVQQVEGAINERDRLRVEVQTLREKTSSERIVERETVVTVLVYQPAPTSTTTTVTTVGPVPPTTAPTLPPSPPTTAPMVPPTTVPTPEPPPSICGALPMICEIVPAFRAS